MDEVLLVWGRDGRGRLCVGTCSAMSAMCREMIDQVGLVSGRVRRGWLNVGTCSSRSAYFRDVFGVVGLLSGLFGEVCLETCSARSI